MEIDNRNRLQSFILEACRTTYASGDNAVKEKPGDGSTTMRYENGAYAYHDNFFGGEPYGGREVVFLNAKPIWMMVYYGFVYPGIADKDVYSFLMDALSHAPLEMPYRGPATFEKQNWRYSNDLTGDVERFSGTERIFKDGIRIYEASYLGGLVDQG